MTVEVTPLGVACNLACTYCYQHPMRDAGNSGAKSYDMEAMKRTLERTGQRFTIFGGEPLLTPLADLEELFSFGLDQEAKRARTQNGNPNAIQTNGALLTDVHIDLFKRYRVSVGFSMDGPDELNDARWAGSTERTREATQRSQTALEKVLAAGIPTSLILTAHRGNMGSPEKRGRVKAWLRALEVRGLRAARLHILEVDHPTIKQLELTGEENAALFREMAAFELELPALRFDVFADIRRALQGSEDVTCTWRACDPYTTSAVHGVDGQGALSNCGRTNKDGVAWLKADDASHERQLALYNTPQEFGGCQGCRFFLQCKGQCPGTAIDGDWRNKSRDCPTWMSLLELEETRLVASGITPISLSPDRLEREMAFLSTMMRVSAENNSHGDHTDHGDTHGDHTDGGGGEGAHGDEPHGDEHGDHTDYALLPQVDFIPEKQ